MQHRRVRLLVQADGYATPGVEAAFARIRELALRHSRTADLVGALSGLHCARSAVADFPGACAWADELMALAADTGERTVERAAHPGTRHARLTRGAVRGLLVDARSAADLRDRALAVAADCPDPYIRTFASFQATNLAVYQRDLVMTRKWATEASPWRAGAGSRCGAAMAEVFDAWAAALQGEPGADRIRPVIDALDARGVRMMRHLLLGLRAEAELAEGRVDDTHRSLAAAFAEYDATGSASTGRSWN